MNNLVRNQLEILQTTQSMRNDLMKIINDDDLRYRLPGNNLTLGELCKQIGETEQAYIDSFRTFKLDLSYRNPEPTLATSAAQLTAWFTELDEQLEAVLRSLNDDDIRNKPIDRGHFQTPVEVHYHIYREALLIFYAKVSLYLRALERDLPGLFATWIE